MSIKTKLAGFTSAASLKLRKEAPTIAVGAGVAGFVGTVVLAVKATPKAEKALEEHRMRILNQKHAMHLASQDETMDYTIEDYRKDTFNSWVKLTVDLVKVYSPAIVLGGLSIASILAGHRIQTQRLMGVTAAYEGLRATFDRYRDTVAEEIGEEKEKEVYKKSFESKTDEGDEEFKFAGPTTRWFTEETTENYRNSNFENKRFLEDVQIAMNERLQQKGHLFLNDVYEALGMDETPLGCQLGWIHRRGHERTSYVDFGLGMNPDIETTERIHETVSSHALLLDFNVDGVIWNLI